MPVAPSSPASCLLFAGGDFIDLGSGVSGGLVFEHGEPG